MALILSLETSTHVCSVALHQAGNLLALAEVHREQSHASKLAVLIDQVMKLADVEMGQLQAVALSSGPGSYTGLRIGASTAKGICYALNIPLIAIGTLELLAAQMQKTNTAGAQLCPMIDARRMEVYCQLFDPNRNKLQEVEAKVIDSESFKEQLEQSEIIFFGNGASKCKAVMHHPNAFFLEGIHPSASELGHRAWDKYQHNQVEDLVVFQPFYLKEFMIKKPSNKEDVLMNKTS